jgi:hypothetical protein
MSLTEDEERTEHLLRVEQMTVNIEKMRQDLASENRKFTLQLAAVIVGSIGATVAVMTFIFSQLIPHLH